VVQIQFLIVMLLGLVMAKLTQEHIREIARVMRNERDYGRPFAFLTGAGCSKSAGIPTAPEIVDQICEGSLGQNIISKFGGKKPTGKDYGTVMGQLSPNQRKDYFRDILKEPKINIGHIALASMMKAGYVGRVLTFNFDSILVRAASMLGLYPAVYDFGISPASTFDHIDEKSVLHLHGQGFGQVMKNTEKDTLEHAKALRLLFNNTMQKSGLIVIGYSGEADAAFPEFHSACCGHKDNPLIWCNFDDTSAPNHVAGLLKGRSDDVSYRQDVNFDEFAVKLAQELGCFSLKFFENPAEHMLDILAPLVPPPDDLPGVQLSMNRQKAKLQAWAKGDLESASDKLNTAMLKGEWVEAISFASEINSEADRNNLAWAYVMLGNELSQQEQNYQNVGDFYESFHNYEAALELNPDMDAALLNWGVALADLAKLQRDEKLFILSFEKFEHALRIKPSKFEALSNLGSALSGLAQLNSDEILFKQSFDKFEAALKIKPGDLLALNNWGNALCQFAKMKKDAGLFRLSFAKFEACLKIDPGDYNANNNYSAALGDFFHLSADLTVLERMENLAKRAEQISSYHNYNLACAYALQDKEDECRAQLLKCKAGGTLPDAKHLAGDEDLQAYWERDWFKALLAG
jgi:tetratricopeptide (TPR) repeat protein